MLWERYKISGAKKLHSEIKVNVIFQNDTIFYSQILEHQFVTKIKDYLYN